MKTDSKRSMGKILLIDDEEDFRKFIGKSLLKHGFEVLEAADGKEGLRRAIESRPDLILCDLLMPQMNGYAVLAALRCEERLAETPLIFLTSQSDPAEVRQGMNLGVDDYLTKPANILDILGAIKARLDRRHAERQRQEKQMDRAMYLFAQTIHDLRNPLFAALTFTNLLKNSADKPAGSHEKSQQIYTGMQQAVTRMQDIISETMFVVRSRMKSLPLKPDAFDLRVFCELLLAGHEPLGRIQFECGQASCPVVADAPRLRHALENLLSNALKYSDGPVLVCLAVTAHGYRIEVRDTGIGIPVEEQASIFEAYFRGSNIGGRPGHGLGLCVARSCIQDHGGTLQFVSHPKQGATFLIDLPASPQPIPVTAEKMPEPAGNLAESPALPPPMPPEPQLAQRPFSIESQPSQAFSKNTAKLRAIVIEDDPVVRNVLREFLEGSNDVLVLGEAATVAQARLLVRQHKPDVLFLDVNLPDGLGFDLLPDLEPNISVVFVTSAGEYAAQAFDCDATDYLVKPVSSDRLQKAVQRVRQRLARQDAVEPVADSRLTGSFLVKTLTEKRLVKISEIKSVIAYGEYSWVYWDKTTKGALLRKSLKRWQSELPREQFVRVHRRAIVNLAFMERVERLPAGRLQIHLRDYKEPILVSLSQTPVLNRHLKTSRRWQPAAQYRNETRQNFHDPGSRREIPDEPALPPRNILPKIG